jgi:nucleoside-triphosphatase THEP1
MIVVNISGKMGSGKTTLANNLAKALEEQGAKVDRTRFSTALYKMHDAIRDTCAELGLDFPGPKFRTLLEKLGTDVFRDYDPEYWVKATQKAVERSDADIVIIDDCRFFNELEAFSNTLKVRLECPEHIREARCDAYADQNHVSNIALDDQLERFDIILDSSELNEDQLVDVVLKYIMEL